ncbi:MAG: AbrB/MazE/SpoVT family DNA-binding domain-containing protein [Coriobacteriia bacterium]
MRVKARKVGNSLTVTIPKEVVLETDISENTDLNIFVREGSVVLEPVLSRWDRLVDRVREQAAQQGVTEADVAEEMQQIRRRPFVSDDSGHDFPEGGER